MRCLKCGREIAEEEVFCEDCLAEAAEYPVNPNTAVYLPRRQAADPAKKPVRRRPVPMDEQIKSLRKQLRILTIVLILVAALAAALLYPAIEYLGAEHYRPGQNYTPMVTTPHASTVPDDADS